MGLHWADHTIEIDASPEQCFEAITDYETFPKWIGAVYETRWWRDRKSKLGEVVKFEVDGKVRKVRYTLKYSYDRPHHITWDFLEGHGIKQLDGEWIFEENGERTNATYKVGIDPGGGVPGPVAKRVNKQTIKRANEDLKAEAERRAKAGGSAPPRATSRDPKTGPPPTKRTSRCSPSTCSPSRSKNSPASPAGSWSGSASGSAASSSRERQRRGHCA